MLCIVLAGAQTTNPDGEETNETKGICALFKLLLHHALFSLLKVEGEQMGVLLKWKMLDSFQLSLAALLFRIHITCSGLCDSQNDKG